MWPARQVLDGLHKRFKNMPVNFSIALNKLPLGEYDCQVPVLDSTAQRAAFWRAPLKLVP